MLSAIWTDAMNEFCTRTDKKWIALAIKAARYAIRSGESPFGAVIATSDTLLAVAYNRTNSTSDPTKHAEVLAINSVIHTHGSKILETSTLYSTCAPCLMCLGVAYYAGIRRLVYSLRIADVVALGSGDPMTEPDELIESLELGMENIKDVGREKAMELVLSCFHAKGSI